MKYVRIVAWLLIICSIVAVVAFETSSDWKLVVCIPVGLFFVAAMVIAQVDYMRCRRRKAHPEDGLARRDRVRRTV